MSQYDSVGSSSVKDALQQSYSKWKNKGVAFLVKAFHIVTQLHIGNTEPTLI